MTCQEIHELLHSPAKLDEAVLAQIDAHISGCESCRQKWDEADLPVSAAHLDADQVERLAGHSGGDVSPADISAWRHAQHCSLCYALVMDFREGPAPLPQDAEEPPAYLADRIWNSYRAAAAAPKATASVPASTPRPSAWEGLKSILSGFGLKPSYAVAAVVIVLAGGWLIHQQRQVKALNDQLTREKNARLALVTELARNVEQMSVTLIPNDKLVLGPQTPEEPSVIITSRRALVDLALPLDDERFVSYRAILQPLESRKEITGQDYLQEGRTNSGRAVIFSIPSTVLEDSRDYVVELQGRNASGTLEKIDTYVFHVVRKQE
jgi:hypothetical protein